MKESTLFKNSAFKDLQTIYISMFGHVYVDEVLFSNAYHRIYETYGLDGLELKLVAYMAQKDKHEIGVGEANRVVGEKGSFLTKVARDLAERGFLKLNYEKWWQPVISLSEKAEQAFNKYKKIADQKAIDFVDYIRDSPQADIMSGQWLQKFKQVLNMQGNEKFKEVWNELHLDNSESNNQKVFCFLLKQFMISFDERYKPGTGPEVASAEEESSGRGDMKSGIDSLVQKGLVSSDKRGTRIAPKVAEAFFHGHDEIVNYKEIANLTSVINSKDIEKKDLFFSAESAVEIENLHNVLSVDGFEYACSVLRKKKRNPAILSLLWGGPGTGKTETVRQIARETGRDIFLFDVAKVTASDWGATENLYRRLFDAYKYIAAVKALTPILLINEADQILSKRLTTIDRSIDKSENIVSNILLQEFEDFHGILLATTNLDSIIDDAFGRRFLFKTELQKPDARARKSIWKSMIPELSDEEAESLADQYVMSGAQISNVVTKRDLAELYFRGDRGLSYIEMLCNKELGLEKRNPKNRHIGF